MEIKSIFTEFLTPNKGCCSYTAKVVISDTGTRATYEFGIDNDWSVANDRKDAEARVFVKLFYDQMVRDTYFRDMLHSEACEIYSNNITWKTKKI